MSSPSRLVEAPPRTSDDGRKRSSRIDHELLFAALDADPRALLDDVMPLLRADRGKERESRYEIRFGRKSSFSISLPGCFYFDHETRQGGGIYKLAKALGLSDLEIAQVYRATDDQTHVDRSRRLEKLSLKRDERDSEDSKRDALKDAEVDQIGKEVGRASPQALQYLKNRGLDHPHLSALIRSHRNPVLRNRDGSLSRLCHSMVLPITSGGSKIVAWQFTQIDGFGYKAFGKRARRSLGQVGLGFGEIAGTENAKTALVGEGFETTASAWLASPQCLALACIGSIRADARLAMRLEGFDQVVILSDRDQLKRNHQRCLALGEMLPTTTIKLASPPDAIEGDKADFNDVLMKEGKASIAAALASAVEVCSPVKGRTAVELIAAQNEVNQECDDFFDYKTRCTAAKEEQAAEHDRIGSIIAKSRLSADEKLKRLKAKKAAASRKIARRHSIKFSEAACVTLNVTPGVGKTRSILMKAGTYLQSLPDDQPFTIEVLTPNHRLAAEAYDLFHTMFPDVMAFHVKGRGQRANDENALPDHLMEDGLDPVAMCFKHVSVNEMARSAMSIKAEACPTCPLTNLCQTNKQESELKKTEGHRRMLFSVHSYLKLPPQSRPWTRRDMMIIDENPSGQATSAHSMPVDLIDNPAVMDDCVKRADLQTALRVAEKLSISVTSGDLSGLDIDELRAFSSLLRQGAKGKASIGHLSAAEIAIRVNATSRRWRPTLQSLAGDAIKKIRAGFSTWHGIRKEMNNDNVLQAKWTTAPRLQISKVTPVMALDGTAQEPLVQLLFDRKTKMVDIAVERNIKLTKSEGATFSRATLLGLDQNGDYEIGRLDKLVQAIVGLGRKPTFLIGDKAVIKTIEKMITDDYAGEDWLNFGWFGMGRGINAFEHCEQAIVLGRCSPRPEDLEDCGRALALKKRAPFMTIDDYLFKNPDQKRRRDGYIDRNGSAWHPDPIVEALRFTACEAEILQGIDRTRPVRAAEPIKVVMLNEIKLSEMRPHEIIPAGNVKKGYAQKTKIHKFVADHQRWPVLPTGALWMHKLDRELFPSVDNAKRELRKVARDPMLKVDRPKALSHTVKIWTDAASKKPVTAICRASITKEQIVNVFGPVHRFHVTSRK